MNKTHYFEKKYSPCDNWRAINFRVNFGNFTFLLYPLFILRKHLYSINVWLFEITCCIEPRECKEFFLNIKTNSTNHFKISAT